jgi:sugar phosphate permease
MQALFEGAMYTFVFLWTPSLSKGNIELPHGHIFANFMVSCMVGSALANTFMSSEIKPEYYMQFVFALSSICMLLATATIYSDLSPEVSISVAFTCFCLFEIAVGVFWPSMMEMRSQYVPEEVRSTVMNIFRMPLNVFVCSILFNVNENNLGGMFLMCAAFLAAACYCQVKLYSTISAAK